MGWWDPIAALFMNPNFSITSASPTTTLIYTAKTHRNFGYSCLKHFDLVSFGSVLHRHYCLVIKEIISQTTEICLEAIWEDSPATWAIFLLE